MSGIDVARLRAAAIASALPARGSLAEAVARLGFVQYDPIRRPCAAQDLILRQRVRGYRAGDLGRAYPRLGLDEDTLYVYGAMSRELRGLLHPRLRDGQPYRPEGLAADVLAAVRESGPVHPNEVAARFGRSRVVNAWGGMSAATTRLLDELQYYGLVRVARRDAGVRVYEACEPPSSGRSPEERARGLARHVVRALGPVSDVSLRQALAQVRRHGGLDADWRGAIDTLVADGEVEASVVGGARYLWLAGTLDATAGARGARLLAPFDPLVWDRRRFEHLFGWDYRFEAYTPAPKRRFGYYALPLLYAGRVAGWANCDVTPAGLAVSAAYAGPPPRQRGFRAALETEAASLAATAGVPLASVSG